MFQHRMLKILGLGVLGDLVYSLVETEKKILKNSIKIKYIPKTIT